MGSIVAEGVPYVEPTAALYQWPRRKLIGAARREARVMATVTDAIDISENPELLRLVDRLRGSRGSVVLRRGEEDVALVTPAKPSQGIRWRQPTEEDYAAFRSAAGSWQGHLDAEQFIKDNRARRQIATRPPVDL